MPFYGSPYPLYYPQYISGYERVKITTMNQTNMTETEPLTKGLVIFGATGDLCKRKLIPSLYKLWQKNLLPDDFVITGTARRDPGVQAWKESLGDYPDEFLHHLDYISADLDNVDTLRHLPDYLHDNTYFLSVPPERYANAIINLKEAGLLDDPDHSRLVIEKPFGSIINLLIIYSLWWSDIYAKNKYIALTIILAKILLIVYLLLGLVIFCWNHFGTASI